MKILCPTDFSPTSKNAIHWIANFLADKNLSTIELLHCIEYPKILDKQGNIGSLLLERAQEYLDELVDDLAGNFPNIEVISSIHKENPKSFIVDRAKTINADLIVLGTSGFTAIKDLTVGSVTEYISNHSTIPVLAIPPDCNYKGLDKIVVGVDRNELKQPQSIEQLVHFVYREEPTLVLTQVLNKGEHLVQFDYRIDNYLMDLDYEHHSIERSDIVGDALTEFAKTIEADLLCMIHHQHNWLGRLFYHSHTKDVLFSLKLPFLIIPDVAVRQELKKTLAQYIV